MLLATLALVVALDTNVVRDIAVGPGEVLRTTSIGSGRPIVLIPGIFGGAFGFRKITRVLAERGYRCIVIEPLGFGASSHPPEADYSFGAQADRIGRAIDSLDARDALVVGQAAGAAMAYRIAYRRHDLILGMMSIDGGPGETASTPGLRHALRFGGFLTKLFVGAGTLRKKVRDQLIENSGDATWITDDVVEAYTAGQATDVDGAIDAMRKMSKSKEPESLHARLHEVVVPVRLVLGAFPHPTMITAEELGILQGQLPDFAAESVSGAGQYIAEEQPDVLIAALEQLEADAQMRAIGSR